VKCVDGLKAELRCLVRTVAEARTRVQRDAHFASSRWRRSLREVLSTNDAPDGWDRDGRDERLFLCYELVSDLARDELTTETACSGGQSGLGTRSSAIGSL
jgi:hypothetical protein